MWTRVNRGRGITPTMRRFVLAGGVPITRTRDATNYLVDKNRENHMTCCDNYLPKGCVKHIFYLVINPR